MPSLTRKMPRMKVGEPNVYLLRALRVRRAGDRMFESSLVVVISIVAMTAAVAGFIYVLKQP